MYSFRLRQICTLVMNDFEIEKILHQFYSKNKNTASDQK